MSAPIAPAKVKAIQTRRLAGARMKDIAAAESVSESTVRRICDGVDSGVALFDQPAARLTDFQVAVLQALAMNWRGVTCPACSSASVAPKSKGYGTCPVCRTGWAAVPVPDVRTGAVASAQQATK